MNIVYEIYLLLRNLGGLLWLASTILYVFILFRITSHKIIRLYQFNIVIVVETVLSIWVFGILGIAFVVLFIAPILVVVYRSVYKDKKAKRPESG